MLESFWEFSFFIKNNEKNENLIYFFFNNHGILLKFQSFWYGLTWASWLCRSHSNVDTHHRHSLLSPEGAGSRLRARTRAIVSPNHPGIISGKFIFRQKSWKFWKISKKVKNQGFFNNPEISSKCLICAAPRLAHGIRARNLARTSRGIAKRPKPSRETSYASLWWS